MAFNKKKAYNDNYNAIKELFTTALNKELPDKEIISKYVGYGGLKEILLDPNDLSSWTKTDLTYKDDVTKLHHLIKDTFKTNPSRAENAINSLKNSVLTSFYTDNKLIDSYLSPLINVVGNKANILDPSCGTGNYITSLKKHFPDATISGVEKEGLAYYIASKIHNDINGEIIHKPLQETHQELNKGTFDLITSNIPFGSTKIYDPVFYRSEDKAVKESLNKIHDYFFTKGLDLLKPGGTLAYITSTGIMDSKKINQREYLMQNAEIINCFRLPRETFKDNAGTEVNSDIIILKKRNQKITDPSLLNDDEISFIQNGNIGNVEINGYYAKYPEKILGTFEKGYLHNREVDMVTIKNSNYKNMSDVISFVEKELIEETKHYQIEKDLTNEPDQLNLFSSTNQLDLFAPSEPKKYDNIILQSNDVEHLPLFTLYAQDNVIGRIDTKEGNYILIPEDVSTEYNKVIALNNIQKAYYLLDKNIGDKNINRSALNAAYDHFVEKYNYINHKNNKAFINLFDDVSKLKGLELEYENKYIKSGIFEEDTVKEIIKASEIGKASTLEDAITLSFSSYNKIDIDFIAQNQNLTSKEVIEKGLNQNLLFPQPDFTDFNFILPKENDYRQLNSNWNFVDKNEFYSGPIKFKREWLENHAPVNEIYGNYENIHFKHYESLKDVEPEIIPISLLDVKLGESWVEPSIYKDFAEHLFEVNNVNVDFNESLGKWKVKSNTYSPVCSQYFNIYAKNNRTYNGEKLLEYALEGNEPIIKYSIKGPDNSKIYKVDHDSILKVRTKVEEINNRFSSWLESKPELGNYLENKYYNLYNRDKLKIYDGKGFQVNGLQNFELRPHQKNAAFQIMQNNGGICDHKVGAGKSLVMAVSAMKLKELGICNKPMIAAKNANYQELYKDFKKAFPEAKVLCPKKSEFTKKNREVYFQKIANNNWDCVILSHDQFKMIEQSPDIQSEIIKSELDNLEKDLNVLTYETGRSASKRELKGLETRKENLQAKLAQLADIKKDKVVSFDKMGIDHLMIDESQVFKNLAFTTRHQRVAGLGNPLGSQISFQLLIACRTLQDKHGGDKGISFYSGTTISNSLVELYSLFKYLSPNKMQELNIKSFDQWARTFAELSTDTEITITNEIKINKRFRAFNKVPELSKMYASISNVVNDNNLQLDKPELVTENVTIKPTEQQLAFTKELVEAVKSENFSKLGKSYSQDQLNAKMLIATNLAEKASLDLRLIDPDNYDEYSGGKISPVAEKINQEYYASNHFKGTQIVFCDKGVPYTKTSEESISVYHELKKHLIENYNIPENEIAFAHDYNTNKKKSELYKNVNSGDIRVVIGSTGKLGVGVNMQERVVAMHHMDLPWKPDDLEQRCGRGARQGNIGAKEFNDNKVKNYIYCTERSLDAYKYYLLDLKERFINQIKDSTVTARRIDEGDMDEGSMSKSAIIAELTGQKEVMELSKNKAVLDEVRRLYSNELQQKVKGENTITESERKIKITNQALENLKAELPEVKKLCKVNKDDKPIIDINIMGKNYKDQKASGEALINITDKLSNDNAFIGTKEIGSCGNFKIYMNKYRNSSEFENDTLIDFYNDYDVTIKKENSSMIYKSSSGKISNVPGVAGRYVFDSLNTCERKINNLEQHLKDYHSKIEVSKRLIEKANPEKYKDQIDALTKKNNELLKTIQEQENSDLKENQDNSIVKEPSNKYQNKGLSM